MALPIEPPSKPDGAGRDPEEAILETAAALEVPEGYRVQVIDGRIIVTPPPDGRHALAVEALADALRAAGARRKGARVLQGVGLYLRPGKKGFVIPDLAVLDEDFVDHPLPYNCYPATVFRLVAEVTSSNWRDDTESKAEAYARVGVPVYVVADREHGTVRVLSRPLQGRYQNEAEYLPGDTVAVPGSVPCELGADDLLQA